MKKKQQYETIFPLCPCYYFSQWGKLFFLTLREESGLSKGDVRKVSSRFVRFIIPVESDTMF